MLRTKNIPRISYDSKYDVMSYIVGDTSNSYGDEEIDNIIILRDIDSEDITGYTIMNFKKICKSKKKEYTFLQQLFDVKEIEKKYEK